MRTAQGFRDLRAYQLAFSLAMEIFQVSKSFPKEERYSLTDQIRRASRSVAANVAEGYRKKRYPKMFVSKMADADGEATENSSLARFRPGLRISFTTTPVEINAWLRRSWKDAWWNDQLSREIRSVVSCRLPPAVCCLSFTSHADS